MLQDVSAGDFGLGDMSASIQAMSRPHTAEPQQAYQQANTHTNLEDYLIESLEPELPSPLQDLHSSSGTEYVAGKLTHASSPVLTSSTAATDVQKSNDLLEQDDLFSQHGNAITQQHSLQQHSSQQHDNAIVEQRPLPQHGSAV